MSGWQAHFITLFPEMFPGSLGKSLTGRALDNGVWHYITHNLRDFGEGRHKNVDDTPSGGGPSMVLRADIAGAAIDAVRVDAPDLPLVLPSPRGEVLTQSSVRELADGNGVIFLCNRFEGVDERIIEAYDVREVSIGDYILSGGEPAALVMVDAILRLLPGVIGDAASHDEESFANGLLEYPQYTRPAIWRGRSIPEALTSGDHARVAGWRATTSAALTKARRPDLWAARCDDKKPKKLSEKAKKPSEKERPPEKR